MTKIYKIGQIVPSSNTTMETEIPAMLRARELVRPERFTFHSARMRMKHVKKEELAAMDAHSDRCAEELSDAAVDVLGYACLVAIMSMGLGYHRESQARLSKVTAANGHPAPVVTSAGALVEALKVMGAKKIAVVTPYMKPLTQLVVDYIAHEGFEVLDSIALEIPDNLDVARHDPGKLPEIVAGLSYKDADVIVLSACVQMPSLASVAKVEALTGKPVISAAIATTYQMLKALNLEPVVPGAGALLSGAY
ncbi:maleate cis-trans isomerase family protein [Acidocella aminolytica]|uniref:Maleate isomerase n=1 Tax=Acidocella aminolytica 101 = DSM 11237 TaxID=1120923 RepID=A0A0D6PGZ5_9PROT|nr:Asp/Glu racemase [Acidocella aminolytica]GAN81050.1 Asp/Glu racemase [Acidocella aminolytica 101 = DSM 11237]GBQ42772.1 Asp/Glu racemase [Acidocella aminolytica 101 = DSM 11237]SHF18619.1 maleate isomerase [Acidocella aminolytica 101 = DSM 11237]